VPLSRFFLRSGAGLCLAAQAALGATAVQRIAGRLFVTHTLVYTTSAIPEPSTCAALFGVAALGLTAWRRRGRAASSGKF